MVRQDKLTTHALGLGGLGDENRLWFNKVRLEATSKHAKGTSADIVHTTPYSMFQLGNLGCLEGQWKGTYWNGLITSLVIIAISDLKIRSESLRTWQGNPDKDRIY